MPSDSPTTSKKQFVWAVEYGCRYEGGSLYGIFKTKRRAEKWVEKFFMERNWTEQWTKKGLSRGVIEYTMGDSSLFIEVKRWEVT